VQYDIISDLYGNKSNGFYFFILRICFLRATVVAAYNRETETRRMSESEWNNIVRSTFQNEFSVCLVIAPTSYIIIVTRKKKY